MERLVKLLKKWYPPPDRDPSAFILRLKVVCRRKKTGEILLQFSGPHAVKE
jgi:hypothetical protein